MVGSMGPKVQRQRITRQQPKHGNRRRSTWNMRQQCVIGRTRCSSLSSSGYHLPAQRHPGHDPPPAQPASSPAAFSPGGPPKFAGHHALPSHLQFQFQTAHPRGHLAQDINWNSPLHQQLVPRLEASPPTNLATLDLQDRRDAPWSITEEQWRELLPQGHGIIRIKDEEKATSLTIDLRAAAVSRPSAAIFQYL